MGKKFALGKGLSALIPDESFNIDDSNKNSTLSISINKIRTNYTEKSVYYFAEQLFQQIKEYPYNEYAGYYIFDLREKPFQGSLGK